MKQLLALVIIGASCTVGCSKADPKPNAAKNLNEAVERLEALRAEIKAQAEQAKRKQDEEEFLKRFQQQDSVFSVAFSPDGETLAAGGGQTIYPRRNQIRRSGRHHAMGREDW